jgi:hypothetical protein
MIVYIFCIFSSLTILTCFNTWKLDLTCNTIYIGWFVNFCNLYLNQMDSEINIKYKIFRLLDENLEIRDSELNSNCS